MKTLILGGNGMLGHKVYQVLRTTTTPVVTIRGSRHDLERFPGLFEPDHVLDQVEVRSGEALHAVITHVAPDVVINCVGIVKQLPAAHDPIPSVEINALLPHRLAAICAEQGVRLIHVSTDCVFSGRRGMYTEDDVPDPIDLYGRSKLLGEVSDAGCLTLRTSIIGRELSSSNGLVEWFLSAPGPAVRGYSNAIFSGLPTLALAQCIADVIHERPALTGLYHVSAAPIDKLALLQLLRDAYGRTVEITPYPDVKLDRSLDSTRFRDATGFAPAPWPTLIAEMAADPTPYVEWRSHDRP